MPGPFDAITYCLDDAERDAFYADLNERKGVVDATATINGRTVPLSDFARRLAKCFEENVEARANEIAEERIASVTDALHEVFRNAFPRT
jgi:hypothetical protein